MLSWFSTGSWAVVFAVMLSVVAHGLTAILSASRCVQILSSRSLRTSRGSIVHNLANGIRLRESARAIELLGDPSDEALQQLVKTANQRFGSSRVTLLGRKDVQRRLARIAVERGLQITHERER